MKKYKKIGVVLIWLSALITAVGIFFAVIVGHKKGLIKSMQLIKQHFNTYSIAVVQIYDIKEKIIEKTSNYDEETFKDEYEELTSLADQYTNNIKTMENSINVLESKCKVEYTDLSVNIMCDNYQLLYETMINEYINQMSSYNKVITTHNESSDTKYELYTAIKTDYIDFNADGKYEAVVTEEE